MKSKIKIKVKGHLDKKWQDYFGGLEISYEKTHTVLSGSIKDEAFMHGILSRIRDLNLKLISVDTDEEN